MFGNRLIEQVHFGVHSQSLKLDSFLSVVKNVYVSAVEMPDCA
jgi:hypothetical protein